MLNGIFFTAYKTLGGNCREHTYCEIISELLNKNKIKFTYQQQVPLKLYEHQIRKRFTDFIIEDSIVIEVKVKDWATTTDFAQLHEYLRLTGHKLGLLVLFKKNKAQIFRVLNLY